MVDVIESSAKDNKLLLNFFLLLLFPLFLQVYSLKMGYNDWSDDESTSRNHGRDKFRHERSDERDRAYGNDEYDRYDRKKRGRRSPTPPEGI